MGKSLLTQLPATKASYQPGSSYKTNKNLNLYAVWKANAYKIAFNKNGGSGSMSTVSRTYDKASALPANAFKRRGYKFKGWNTKSNGTGTSYTDKASVKNLTSTSGKTVTLYAQWVKGQKLTYNANGGKVSTTSKIVYQGSAYGTLATPTRTGYTFAGWYTAKSGGSKVTSSTKVTKSSGHTLYAHWTKTKYTIKYVLNGGKNNTGNPSGYYASSSTITLKNPARTGYTFAGWYTSSSYKTKATQIAKGSTGNKSFYAKWSANTYTIRYSKNGGTGGSMADTKSCKYDTAYKLRANTFKRAGYQFAGWASSSSGAVVYKDKASVKNLTSTNRAVKTLYAKWTPYTYTINYHLNGGKNSTSNPDSYKVSSSTITLKNASRTGYTFKGWYTDSGCKKKITQITKGNTGTKNLYAKWSANVYTIRYDKNGADGGSMADSTGCRYGTEYALRTNTFIRKNYKFTGWNTKKDGSGKSYDDNAKVKNLATENNKIILVYAQWKALTAIISFDNTSMELRTGDTFQLRPVITPAEVDSEIEYTSVDEAVASVNNQGMISAIAAGETEIYCKATDGSGVETEVKVVVTDPTVEVTSVEVITDTFTVKAGDTFQAGVTVIPEDATDPAVSWSVSDPSVITVDENGYITAVGEGEADIIAVADNGVMGTIRITVENDTVQISNAEELTGIRNDLNGKYELTSDIDLSGYEWIPIGTSTAPFSGILNGNGHTISGLIITDSTQEYSGLFGYLTGEVQDLIVDGRMNLTESNGSRFRYAGSITAYAQKAKILNCISYVSVNAENTNTTQGTYLYAGGIAGSADSYTQIENCENYGGIYGTACNGTRTSAYAGGIAGETLNGTVISQCTNNGEIAASASTEFTDYFATAYAGGITGSAGAAKVLDSVNHQTVTAKTFPLMETAYESSAAAGGIVGYAIQSTVEGGSTTENISAEGNEYSKAYFGTEIGRYVE